MGSPPRVLTSFSPVHFEQQRLSRSWEFHLGKSRHQKYQAAFFTLQLITTPPLRRPPYYCATPFLPFFVPPLQNSRKIDSNISRFSSIPRFFRLPTAYRHGVLHTVDSAILTKAQFELEHKPNFTHARFLTFLFLRVQRTGSHSTSILSC